MPAAKILSVIKTDCLVLLGFTLCPIIIHNKENFKRKKTNAYFHCMYRIFVSFFLVLSITVHSQKLLKGLVADEENKPVPDASVYLNNTSLGTRANEQGRFELYIPAGKFDLIVSSIGYETFNKTITAGDVQDFITVKLKLKVKELETVVVEPYEKEGWQKWGTFFLENFIGTSSYSNQCRIKNNKVIKFRNSKKNNELTAYASEPLIIENKALGYTIHYQLEAFSYNFKTHFLFYEGYPFFEPMKGNATKQMKWEKKRSETYYGSIMHFMRSVYQNTILQEGFEIHALQKIPNLEKRRVKAAYERNLKRTETSNGTLIVGPINKDSDEYYNRILKQEDYTDVVDKNILPGDSIAYGVDSMTAGLDFPNYLLVIYKNKTAAPEYRQRYPQSGTAIVSQIFLPNQKPIEIQLNGSYYDPADLVSSGYWAWSEKIATMLPFDYKPPKK